MTLAQVANLLGVIGFLLAVISLGMTVWNRGKEHGRLAQAIDASTTSDREVSNMLQAQGQALKSFAEAMKEQSAAMRDVALGFRDFASTQKQTNEELWTSIQVQSGRINRLVEARESEGRHEEAA